MIISADIGGTKTNIGLSTRESPTQYLKQFTFLNENFDSFDDIVTHFSEGYKIDVMVLGIAGPITSRTVQLTNLHWKIHADRLEEKFECQVFLLNDLQAFAYSIPYLDKSHIEIIHKSQNSINTKVNVIVASGTGLGVAKLYREGSSLVFASEGGHIGFSPKSKFQERFFKYVQKRTTHVSCEMVMSSIGFKNLKNFLIEDQYFDFSDEFKERLSKSNNPSKFLSDVIKSQDNSPDVTFARLILEEISHMLGSFLGDLSLIHLPNTIYLTGGIGRNIVLYEYLKKGFLEKANMEHVVQNTSLSLIKDPDVGLHGTSWYAYESFKND